MQEGLYKNPKPWYYHLCNIFSYDPLMIQSIFISDLWTYLNWNWILIVCHASLLTIIYNTQIFKITSITFWNIYYSTWTERDYIRVCINRFTIAWPCLWKRSYIRTIVQIFNPQRHVFTENNTTMFKQHLNPSSHLYVVCKHLHTMIFLAFIWVLTLLTDVFMVFPQKFS